MPTRCRQSACALRLMLLVCVAALAGACAGARGPDAGPPRANEPAYPVIIAASTERRELAAAAWQALAQEQGLAAAPTPELRAVTATIAALPAGITPRLPKVELPDKGA